GNAGALRLRECCRHLALVDVVRARKRNAHDGRRQACGLELRGEQLLANAVHAHATELVRHRGERADDLELARTAHLVQRPGAGLAARPGDQRPRHFLPSPLNAASAARSPASQAPPTVPHRVSCVASPANQRRSLSGSDSALRAHCPPGAAAENAPSAQGSRAQRVACVRLIACLISAPNRPASQSIANVVMAVSPSPARAAPRLPRTSTRQRREPEVWASRAALRAPVAFSNTRSSLCSPSGLPENSIAT